MAKVKNGDCVFFNEFQTGASRKSTRVRVKNLAYGVLLGALPPFGKDPSAGDLFRSLGSIGYVSFDDIGEFLGPELGQKCVEMFEKKYYVPAPGPLKQEDVAAVLDKVEAAEPSALLDAHGVPVGKDET